MTQVIPNWLKKRADLTPDRKALIFNDEELTFQQVFEQSARISSQLNELGLKKGGSVGVLLSNHKETVLILYALQMTGVRTVILNNKLTSAELLWQLEDSQVEKLIYEKSFNEKVTEIRKSFQHVVEKEELFQLQGIEGAILEEYDLEEITTIMYTSGTTGHPKGVMQSYGNHWWSATASALNLGLSDKDCWLCAVPVFHISGYSILMRSLIYGMAVVLHSNFNAKLAIEDIWKYQVTTMSVVSTMLLKINDLLIANQLPDTFRGMLLGGGPAPLSLLEKCKEKGIPVYQSFGMTETSSQFATLAPEYSLSKLGSAGKPLLPNQIKIINDIGETLPNGQEGEILVKGPNVTKGYLNRDKETKEKLSNGWFHTGDIGYLDQDGFLYVLDRRSDLIISGGENIYPAEIESVLMAHETVADVGVIGIDNHKWGQVPIAFIVKKSNTHLSESDLVQFCTDQLARYKVPKRFLFVEQLPRNASKKLLRRELRDWYKKGYE